MPEVVLGRGGVKVGHRGWQPPPTVCVGGHLVAPPPPPGTYPVSFDAHVPLEAGEAFLALRERMRREMAARGRGDVAPLPVGDHRVTVPPP